MNKDEKLTVEDSLFVSMDGTHFTRWEGLKSVNLETINEPLEERWSNNQLYFDDWEFVGKFKPKAKHSKKSFRKWAMSKGCSRDEANAINKLVADQKGQISYETLYLSVIFGVYFGS